MHGMHDRCIIRGHVATQRVQTAVVKYQLSLLRVLNIIADLLFPHENAKMHPTTNIQTARQILALT